MGELKKCDGEATANNRKAKLIFLFEWELKVDFIARVSGSETEYKGYLEIPNLSDENEASEVDVNTTIDTKGPHEAQIRQMLNKKGTTGIQDLLAVYIRELKEEFSKGLILPTDKVKPQVVTKGKTTTNVDKKNFQNTVVTDSKPSEGRTIEKFDLKKVSVSDTYKVPPSRLYEVLSEANLVKAWANGNIDWDFKEGGKFALFGGNATGKFLKIEPNKSIEVEWRLRNYPDGHHARITFTLKDEGDGTSLDVDAVDVPSHMAEDTQNGLQRYYVMSIGRTFGFGARMF